MIFITPTRTTARLQRKVKLLMADTVVVSIPFDQKTSDRQVPDIEDIDVKCISFLDRKHDNVDDQHNQQEVKCPGRPQVMVARGAQPTSVIFN